MFLLGVLHKVHYWLSTILGSSTSYESFLAKNVFWVIFISKMAITAMHLLSFYILHTLTLELTRKREIALLSVLAYGTTFPVLFYINNISPEPIMVSFTLLAFIWTWRYLDCIERGDHFKGYLYISFAAIASVCAFYTKFMIVAPLLILIPLYILLGRPRSQCQTLGWRERVRDTFIFAGMGGMLLVLGSYKVDLGKFFSYWAEHTPGQPIYNSLDGFLMNMWEILRTVMVGLPKSIFDNIVTRGCVFPQWNNPGMHNLSEMTFVGLGSVAAVVYWRNEEENRHKLTTILAFALMTAPIILYRCGSHYYVIHLALISVFFSYSVYRAVAKVIGTERAFLMCAVTTLIVHTMSLVMFVDAKVNDINGYECWKPYYDGLSKINGNERIGVVGSIEMDVLLTSMVGHMFVGHPSSGEELQKLFVRNKDGFSDEMRREGNIRIIIRADERMRIEGNEVICQPSTGSAFLGWQP